VRRSQTFEGNAAEAKTLEHMLKDLGASVHHRAGLLVRTNHPSATARAWYPRPLELLTVHPVRTTARHRIISTRRGWCFAYPQKHAPGTGDGVNLPSSESRSPAGRYSKDYRVTLFHSPNAFVVPYGVF
jgi:hypothetical protein